MEKILNQSHDANGLFLALSRLFERSSYYGIRAIIVLYMVSDTMMFSHMEAYEIYGWLTLSFVFTQIVGALLGDFVLGNKWSTVIGGILQAIGALSLAFPSIITFYLGLGLISLGGGFYTPNLISLFGKTYSDKPKLLDAGFTILYIAVNIGAMIGALIMSLIGNSLGWHYGFIIAAILSIIAIIFPLVFNEKKTNWSRESFKMDTRVLKIAGVTLISALFWGIYEFAGRGMYIIQDQLSQQSELISTDFWQFANPAFVLPLAIIATIIWTNFHHSRDSKLLLGFLIGALSFGIMLSVSSNPNESQVFLYSTAIFLLAISEVLIAPTLFSVITQYTNPKYLAIIIAVSYVPSRILFYVISLFNRFSYDEYEITFGIPIIVMCLVAIGLGIYLMVKYQNKTNAG